MNKTTRTVFLKMLFLVSPIILGLTLYSVHLLFAASSPDAIGVRVVPNPKHFSAARWYREQGFKGSPQSMIVDGYEAIRDGRTVYIDVANVVEVAPINHKLTTGDQFFTNIFIISYNQDAEKATADIFGQILANWKFNSNIMNAGACNQTVSKSCIYGPSCVAPECPTCAADEYCVSSHDVSVRDTRRLADLNDLGELLSTYKANNGGLCPKLESGSYLPNKSVSTWPSWQETLGKALGQPLPFDPINRLGNCSNASKTGNQYTATAGVVWCLNNGATYTGHCGVLAWDYVISVPAPGDYDVTVETTNANSSPYGDLDNLTGLPPAHPTKIFHNMTISVDGVVVGTIQNAAVGPTRTPEKGKVVATGLTAGNHTVRVNWTNDYNDAPNGIDSNIRIHRVTLGKYYNSATCWDEKNRQFADPTPADANFDLPDGSRAYVYLSSPDGKNCGFFATMESGLVCNAAGVCTVGNNLGVPSPFTVSSTAIGTGNATNTPPVISCGNMVGIAKNAFTGFISASDQDGDVLMNWQVDPVTPNNWNTWQAVSNWQWQPGQTKLLLAGSTVPSQKKLLAAKAGDEGVYKVKVSVSDGQASTSQICSISINNSCHVDQINFDEGTMDGLVLDNNTNTASVNNTSVAGGDVLKVSGVMPTPYIWLAYSNFAGCTPGVDCDRVVKIRTADGYKKTKNGWDKNVWETRGQKITTTAVGSNPSRTAVNIENGDVWVANRGSNNIHKLDIDGNVLKSCITGGTPRGIAIEANGDVWIANSTDATIVKLSGDDTSCGIIKTINVGGLPYGLAIDSENNLWIANRGASTIQKVDTKTFALTSYALSEGEIYGITVDTNDNVWAGHPAAWAANDPNGGFYKLPKGGTVPILYKVGHSITGVSVDLKGSIWGSGYVDSVAVNIDQSGVVLRNNLPTGGSNPHGICGDSYGQIWSVNRMSNSARVFDLAGNIVTTTPVNPLTYVEPYTYSDMTGLNRAIVMRFGTWVSRVYDSGKADQYWGRLMWTQYQQSDKQSVEVFIKSGNSTTTLETAPWIKANLWNGTSGLRTGRYVQIKAKLRTNERNVTPVITNMQFTCDKIATCADGILEDGSTNASAFDHISFAEECDPNVTSPVLKCEHLKIKGLRNEDGSVIDCNQLGVGFNFTTNQINSLYAALCQNCGVACVGDPNFSKLSTGCYLDTNGNGKVDPLESDKGLYSCVDTGAGNYQVQCTQPAGWAGVAKDYCTAGNIAGLAAQTVDVVDITIAGSGSASDPYLYKTCDEYCRDWAIANNKRNMICVGVGFNDGAGTHDECVGSVHDMGGGNCQLLDNQAAVSCKNLIFHDSWGAGYGYTYGDYTGNNYTSESACIADSIKAEYHDLGYKPEFGTESGRVSWGGGVGAPTVLGMLYTKRPCLFLPSGSIIPDYSGTNINVLVDTWYRAYFNRTAGNDFCNEGTKLYNKYSTSCFCQEMP
jgi:streptogramin lyase